LNHEGRENRVILRDGDIFIAAFAHKQSYAGSSLLIE